MVLGLALLIAQSPAMAVEPSPDLVVPSMAAPQALERLGEAVGETLTTDATLRDEFLVFRIREVNGRETMADVAEALDAVWERTEQGWRLTRTAEQERAIERAKRNLKYETLSEELRPLVTGVRSAADLDEIYRQMESKNEADWQNPEFQERMRRLSEQLPEARMAKRLVASVGVEPLLQVVPGETRVFALDPTPMQYALPPEVATVFSESTEEIANVALTDAKTGYDPFQRGEPALYLLKLSSMFPGVFQAQVEGFTGQGERVFTHSESIGDGSFGMRFGSGRDERFADLDLDLDSLKEWAVTLWPSPLYGSAAEVSGLPQVENLDERKAQAKASILTGKGPDYMTKPISDMLLSASEQLDRDLIAVVPPASFMLMGFSASPTDDVAIDPARMFDLIQAMSSRLEITENLISFDETRPQMTIDFSLDRSLMRDLLKLEGAENGLTLDLQAAIHAKHDIDQLDQASFAVAAGLSDGDAFRSMELMSGNRYLLQFYGGLSGRQRQQARTEAGLGLTYGQLNGDLRAALDKMVFWEGLRLRLADRDSFGAGHSDLLAEPTVLFGNGIPRGLQIRVVVSEQEQVMGLAKAGFTRPVQPRDIAFGELSPYAQTYESFRWGLTERLMLVVSYEGWHGETSHGATTVIQGRPEMTLEQLPEGFLRELAEARQRYRENPPFRHEGVGVGKPPQKP